MWVPGIGLGNLLQESGADDTAAAPDLGDLAEIKRPVVFLLRGAHELEALRIRTDLRAVEGVVDRLHKSLLRAAVFLARALQDLRGGNPFLLDGRDAAGKDGLGDGGSRDAHVERVGRGPFTGALLAGGIQDDVDESFLFRERILLFEDVGRDLDEEAVERAGVPFGKDGAHFGRLEAK